MPKQMDFSEVVEILDRVSKRTPPVLKDALDRIGEHAAERSKANAHILSGALRESLHSTGAKISGKVVKVSVESDLPYALRRHEEPTELGPVSAAQPGTPEGGVGVGFVRRVVQYHKEKYEEMIAEQFRSPSTM